MRGRTKHGVVVLFSEGGDQKNVNLKRYQSLKGDRDFRYSLSFLWIKTLVFVEFKGIIRNWIIEERMEEGNCFK